MNHAADRDYLDQRYRQSVERAQRAADPCVARTHQEFAQTYAQALERCRLPAKPHFWRSH